MNRLLIFSIIVLSASCEKASFLPLRERPFVTHTIPAGAHYSSLSTYKAFQDSVLKFTVRFDSSAIYTSKEPSNQADVNKLFGFAEKGGQHENSARFGWNWENKKLNLYAYTYVEGERHILPLGEALIGNEYLCMIRLSSHSYIFEFNNTTKSIPRALNTNIADGYLLYPYFGGDEIAPHQIRIYIKH